MTELRHDHPLSLTRGGPAYNVMRRLHLLNAQGQPRWAPLVLFAWLPPTVLSLAAFIDHGKHDPVLFDASVHVRFLIALPLIVLGERHLEDRARIAMRQFRAGRFANRAAVDAIIDRTEHLRDRWLPEGLLFVMAVLGGQAVLWGWTAPAGVIHGVELGDTRSLAHVWYAAVALPLAQFIVLRWLWHWGLWIYVLVRLSRLRLSVIAIHPDAAGGLGFLDEPIDGFALFVASLAAVASSAWSMKIYLDGADLQTFVPPFLGFLAIALLLGLGPLVLFSGHLYRARRRDLPMHHELALSYVRDFKHKWLQHHSKGEQLLGTSDLQSLNDLHGGFEVTERTRVIPIGPRPVAIIATAALLPMLPAVLTAVPLKEVLAHLGKALVGGLPI
ncbi:MAG: hypothetical protein SFX73_26690 [Kofleriaceae bacterium]|nr:hypothetical protein [Kofleriaceae bacterium]